MLAMTDSFVLKLLRKAFIMADTGKPLIQHLNSGFIVSCLTLEDCIRDAGGDLSRGADILNLTRPDLITRLHGEFADAGAMLIATNTAAANTFCLRRIGIADKMREINIAGAKLAISGAGKTAFIAGAIGPLGLTLDEDWDMETLRDAYVGQITALLEGGVHAIQFLSFVKLEELAFAVGEARQLAGKDFPILAQMIFSDNGLCETGENVEIAAARLVEAGADVVGVNGGQSISASVKAAERLAASAAGKLVAAHPNAGYPETAEGGRLIYMASPSYMGDTAIRLAKTGVRIVGGFSGTTPEMVRAMVLALTTIRAAPVVSAPVKAQAPATAIPAKFKQGAFLESLTMTHPVIAEIDPPPNLLSAGIVEDARVLVAAGAQAISMAENPLASLKMSNMAMAAIIRRELEVHTICHLTCRDHNLLGTQSILMGMHALDIRAVLALTGDPLTASAGQGRSVFDLNSFLLTRLIAKMNTGLTNSGASLKGETDFSIGVAFNTGARNLENEVQRLHRKVDEGARFVMTQPVFDPGHARRVMDLIRMPGLRVFLGFFPLVSARSALYLHNEVPGIRIPEPILAQLTSLPNKEDQEKAGLESSSNLLESLRTDLDGVYLISPHNRPRLLAPLIRQFRPG
ncbi:MAG TPA: bifunctional homocysteine S-methyltransferase/methylenetetrahydrofolate reductase [Lentisphaeria bacterium]|nr:MAG: hypothetical protein A2X45_16760 [Lentisphaerae bacterium GWF2_50_93]HCE44265.1 bifunctional homocysteine S-methyltransferase/methylenetetrahydrofolate reductase [Lentisphaeria bacterium]